MPLNQLKEKSEIYLEGKQYMILSNNFPTISLQLIENGVPKEVVVKEFSDLVTNKTLVIDRATKVQLTREETKIKSLIDTLPPEKKAKAERRFNLIRPVLILKKIKTGDIRAEYEFVNLYKSYLGKGQNPDDLTQDELLDKIASRYKKSKRQLQRYLQEYLKGEIAHLNGGIEALINKKDYCYTRKDERTLVINHPKNKNVVLDVIKVRLAEEYIPIIKEVIEKHFLTNKNMSKQGATDLVNANCTKNGLEDVPYTTMSKIIDKIDPQVIIRMREGKKAVQSLKLVEKGFTNEEARFPLHIVQIDHYRVPIKVIEENTGEIYPCVWLTLGVCLYSRAVWCFYLSFNEPSSNVTRKAIENGIFAKNAKEKYGTENDWPVFGVPQIIYTDNGTDFRSKEIRTLVNQTLQSHLRFRPVGSPNYGGVIENVFGKISKSFLKNLPGYYEKRKFIDIKEDNPEENACLTLEDLRRLLIYYIVDIYHQKENKELPLNSPIPLIRYYEGCKDVGEPYWFTAEEEKMIRLELLPLIEKPVTRMGITFENVIYCSEQLAGYVGNRANTYRVKYNDDDISKIHFLMPDGEYVEIPAVYPPASSLEGMNRFTYKILRKKLIKEGELKKKQYATEEMINRAWLRITEEINKTFKENRTTRKKAAKMGVKVQAVLPSSQKAKDKKQSIENLFQSVIDHESNE